MTAQSPPAIVYRLSLAEDWRRAQAGGYVLYREVDLQSGFLHLSTAAQVMESADKHFSGRTNVVVLGVHAAMFGERLKMEPSRGGALFPHLYGALPSSAVVGVRPLILRAGRFAFAEGDGAS